MFPRLEQYIWDVAKGPTMPYDRAIRDALLGGPRTIYQIANWCRTRGIELDAPGAEAACKRLTRLGVLDRKDGLFILIDGNDPVFDVEEPKGAPTSERVVSPPTATPADPAPVTAPQAPRPVQVNTKAPWEDLIARVSALKEGESLEIPIPQGQDHSVYKSRIRTLFYQRRETRMSRWSVTGSRTEAKIVRLGSVTPGTGPSEAANAEKPIEVTTAAPTPAPPIPAEPDMHSSERDLIDYVLKLSSPDSDDADPAIVSKVEDLARDVRSERGAIVEWRRLTHGRTPDEIGRALLHEIRQRLILEEELYSAAKMLKDFPELVKRISKLLPSAWSEKLG